MREIVFDTETTGLDVAADRVIELGCVELINRIPSGTRFQAYLNPDRPVPIESFRIHGLSDAFLAGHRRFADVVDEFLAFIGDAPLIAHNADFDFAFVNAELARVRRPLLEASRIIDSLVLARGRFPVGPYSLDALCSRFGVDAGKRVVHGALIDASLLAEVYIELTGGRQASLSLGDIEPASAGMPLINRGPVRLRPVPRAFMVSEAELAAHQKLFEGLGSAPVWASYAVSPARPAVAAS